MAKILVVDDEQGILSILTTLLEMNGHEVTPALGGETGSKVLLAKEFDLMITDLRMPNVSGMDLLRLANEHYPSMCVILLTAYGQVETATEAMELGAPQGYIWRFLDAGRDLAPLLIDLRYNRVLDQAYHEYVDSILGTFRAVFGERGQPKAGTLPDSLTPRELEIIRLIGKGYSNQEIAGELVVTINTIKKHTSNSYDKLGVRSRTQAVVRALELNLL